MTVKECYSQMGGDYNNVLSRFYDEAMIKRLLGRFIDDTSFRALEQAKGNRKLAAALLGIGRTTLYNKIRLYGIKYKE